MSTTRQARRTRRAFTLVELLVVIAIIGVLVGLLLPAVQAAREAARRSQCQSHLAQLVLAVQSYELSYGAYPAGTLERTGPILHQPNGYHHNWIVQILPYMEETTTFTNIDFSVGVYHPNNAAVRSVHLRIVSCPSSPMNQGDLSDYAAIHHDTEAPIDVTNNGVFFLNSSVRQQDVRDGLSHTLFLGDKMPSANDLGWMSGTNATLRNTGWQVQTATALPPGGGAGPGAGAPGLPVGGLGSYHPGGVNAAYGDGRLGFLSASVTLTVLQQLGHRADGKLITERSY